MYACTSLTSACGRRGNQLAPGPSRSHLPALHTPLGLLLLPPAKPAQRHSRRVQAASMNDGDGGLELAFQQELAARQQAAEQAEEASAGADFDGRALLTLLQRRYGRSYDVSLVRRQYMGRWFAALNVMWKYKEQKSFVYTEEEFMQRLDYIASVLVAWGSVSVVQKQLAGTKERPRVGKAVSIMLDVPPEKLAEWLG